MSSKPPQWFLFSLDETPLLKLLQAVLPQIHPVHDSPLLSTFLLPLSLFPHLWLTILKEQRPWGMHVTPASLVLEGQTMQSCNFVLWAFTTIRFAGERRAPRRKELSWKRQRTRESRCQSKSMSSRSPEISTTTCAGLPPPGSGTRPSRCVSA